MRRPRPVGEYAQLREGSAWRDLAQLAPAIADGAVDTRFFNLISDDTHPNTLVEYGHLDHILRRAVQEGIDALVALQMVTINTATCFHMEHELEASRPASAPTWCFFSSLADFDARSS